MGRSYCTIVVFGCRLTQISLASRFAQGGELILVSQASRFARGAALHNKKQDEIEIVRCSEEEHFLRTIFMINFFQKNTFFCFHKDKRFSKNLSAS